jgi:2-polyprenyl-3-methyl-5-hydroxy-6-metoxy-1,4-benzoquinol methylase
MENKEHWEKVFATKNEKEVSWFQEYPKTSIEFLNNFDLPIKANIIDVGGGDSRFVDALLEKGYENIFVLDISANAIAKAKVRLGDKANKVNWIISDVLDFKSEQKFDFWQDRAAFHFQTKPENIDEYVNIATKLINNSGYLILGTFSEDGPTKCSGLEIKQYSKNSLSKKFEHTFNRIKCITENHTTPFNTYQNFLFCSFQKK